MRNIREYLSTIVTPKNQKNWCDPELFQQNISPIFPKEIEVVALPPKNDAENYNCFAYAFGLIEEAKEAALPWGNVDSKFVSYLLKSDELRERQGDSCPGDIVLYSDASHITHAGVMTEGKKIISKWSGGPLLKHDILDVPQHYGNDIRFYEKPKNESTIKLFKKWTPTSSKKSTPATSRTSNTLT